MNKRSSCIATALLILGSTNVNAASSTDLSVTGKITPSACVPQLSNGGVVDYGKISIKDVTSKPLQPVAVQLSVNCDASTFFAVKVTDNREGTQSDNSRSSFGLGLGENNHKLGIYQLSMANALADGVVHPIVESFDGRSWFVISPGHIWQPGWMRTINAPGHDYAPIAMQKFTTDVVVTTTINKPRVLTAETALDGSATLDIVYL
ncbi:DUF1120 domain-containing protein [Pseudomonas sp. REP124]|uniref:DUF1120 domain-containing protein n=1 Tax=Pseudomonas sp. REP124 TaxID=2875731 RepID=UPI001CCC1CBD|nr:DUF1120 domain-containing protein [Pseudomonas sp. REP124]MBZ9781425.1 DUF1120 domain-containing protein [Pseudomonas sp. REP124]